MTETYEFENEADTSKQVSAAQTNHDWNTVEEVLHAIGDYLGYGFLNASDFNLTPTGGAAKTGTVNGGTLITGEPNQTRIKVMEDDQAVTCVGTNASPQTNYCYVGQDGTTTIVQNPFDAPANSHLAWSCLCNDAGLSAINQFPDDRRNLLHALAVLVSSNDRQGGYLMDKLVAGTGITFTENDDGDDETLTLSVDAAAVLDGKVKVNADDTTAQYLADKLIAGTGITLTVLNASGVRSIRIDGSSLALTREDLTPFDITFAPGDRVLLEIDFSAVCQFTDGRYFVFTECFRAEDASAFAPGEIIITEMIEDKSATVCYIVVEVPCDTVIGSDSIPNNDITFEVSLVGHGHSDNGGPDPTVTTFEIAADCNKPYDIAFYCPTAPTSAQRLLKFVAPRDILLPASLTGSKGHADTAATAQTDLTVKKNGVSVATIRFAAAGSIPTYIAASDIHLTSADVLVVDAPGSADATLASIAVTLKGTTE